MLSRTRSMKVKCAGLSCLPRKKSSSNVVTLRNEAGKCVCPFCRKSYEEEKKASRTKGGCWSTCCFCRDEESDMGGFCCNKSPKAEEPQRKRGKSCLGFSCCNKPTMEKDPSRKKSKCAIFYRRRNKSLPELTPPKNGCWSCYFCCNESPKKKKKEETIVGGGGEEKAKGCFGCFNCCKSPKVTCSSQARPPTEDDLSPRRGCAEVMGCSWCSKYASKKKSKSSMRLCWKRKEKLKPNNLASLVKSISFKSDSCEKDRSAVEEILHIGNGNIAARVFTYRQLAVATQSFNSECLLGTGGFGRVYKGQLEDTKEVVAVKQLDRQGYQGNREFLIEVLMLSLLNHRNLVNLLGYCADGDERILVYDYMPLGSLQDHLHDLAPDSKPLDWNTRMKIALGAARGLEYLHDTANPPVIYRDLKSSNILLDEDFTPKLSDFGLAKLGPVGEKMHISTRVMGTYGYCAPEYARTGKLTKMSDVYSLGVMLLELITGRKPVDKTRPAKEQVLIEWAAPLFKDKKKFVEMADPLLEGKFPVKPLYQAVAIAALCIQENETTRPVVKDIATALEFLVGQNCDGRQGEPEGSVPQNLLSPEPEMQRSATGGTERFLSPSLSITNWLSFSTVNEEETKNDIDHIT